MTSLRGRSHVASRLYSETVDIQLVLPLPDGQPPAIHDLKVTLAYDRSHGVPVLQEIAFGARGKIGGGMDQLLADLGVKLSRALQLRNPETGEDA